MTESQAGTQLLPFFFYGTLRQDQGNYQYILEGNTTREMHAKAKNQVIHNHGIAFVRDRREGEPERLVIGEVMWVEPSRYARVLRQLDSLEGYNPLTDSGGYRRVIREFVLDTTGETIQAYVYHDGHPDGLQDGSIIDDGDWVLRTRGHRTGKRPDERPEGTINDA